MTATPDAEALSIHIKNYWAIHFHIVSETELTDQEQRDTVAHSLEQPGMEAFEMWLTLVRRWRKRLRDSGAEHQVEVKVGDREMTFGEFVDWFVDG